MDQIISHPDTPDRADLIKRIDEYMEKLEKSWKRYLSLPMDDGLRKHCQTK